MDVVREAWRRCKRGLEGPRTALEVILVHMTLVAPCLIIFLYFVTGEFMHLVCPRILGKPRVFAPCYVFYFVETITIYWYVYLVFIATWRRTLNAKHAMDSILAKFFVIIFALVLGVGALYMLLLSMAATLMQGPI